MSSLRLLELRKAAGYTQAQVASVLNITPQSYSLYETGKNNVNNDILCKLADMYQVSTDYLLGRQEEKPFFLTEKEQKMIEVFRKLDARSQNSILNTAVFEAEWIAQKHTLDQTRDNRKY